jgi:AhpD family alkylhydroperoxidase
MPNNIVEEFNAYRSKMNEKMLEDNNKVIKRMFNIDTNTYMEGVLSKKTKELLGLGNSLVLRCDDCVRYHLEECHKLGFTKEEVVEAMSVSLLIGGTIVIPHLRRAFEYWEALDGLTEN